MTQANERYGTARGVEAAIKDAAKKAAAVDPTLDTNKRIQLEYFNRFLSRIFSEGAESEWVLKGGTSILARIPSTRSTKDIDLYREGFTIEQALADLKRLAAIDLYDHFRFEYLGYETSIGADKQPYTDGYRVTFNIFIGVTGKGSLHIDLAVGAGMTDQVSTATSATALELPRLTSNPYRLYPVVDQIADKVCATMADYEGRPSSREKDLVDLVVFVVTQDIDGDALTLALETERRRRQMEPFSAFAIPPTWGPGYVKLSKSVPCCSDYRTVGAAAELASQLIDLALTGRAGGRKWTHKECRWV